MMVYHYIKRPLGIIAIMYSLLASTAEATASVVIIQRGGPGFQRFLSIVAVILSAFQGTTHAFPCAATIQHRALDLFDPDNTTPIIGTDEQSAGVTIAGFIIIGVFGALFIWFMSYYMLKHGWCGTIWRYIQHPFKLIGYKYGARKARKAAAEYTANMERQYTGRGSGIVQPPPVYVAYSREWVGRA